MPPVPSEESGVSVFLRSSDRPQSGGDSRFERNKKPPEGGSQKKRRRPLFFVRNRIRKEL